MTMQEDQPTFKVTDRRLFNADGSPRDLPPEEKAEPTAAAAPETAAAAQMPEAAEEAQATPEPEVSASPAAAEESPAAEEEFTEDDLADARDPASFMNFLMLLAQNAASTLGMVEHPVT